MPSFPRLFSPITLRNMEIRNRILSTGHQTYLARGGLPGEDFVAYHEARARGGAGLIIVEAARFHATGFTDSPELIVASDDCIPGLKNLADSVHRHGARIFGQISHSGRVTKRISGGLRGVAYAPSVIPNLRFHTMPRPSRRRFPRSAARASRGDCLAPRSAEEAVYEGMIAGLAV